MDYPATIRQNVIDISDLNKQLAEVVEEMEKHPEGEVKKINEKYVWSIGKYSIMALVMINNTEKPALWIYYDDGARFDERLVRRDQLHFFLQSSTANYHESENIKAQKQRVLEQKILIELQMKEKEIVERNEKLAELKVHITSFLNDIRGLLPKEVFHQIKINDMSQYNSNLRKSLTTTSQKDYYICVESDGAITSRSASDSMTIRTVKSNDEYQKVAHEFLERSVFAFLPLASMK